jgi:hypothetical protein
MTPEQLIKQQILIDAEYSVDGVPVVVDEDNVDEIFEEANDDYSLQDDIEEFRCSGEETGLDAPHSRHYECDAVARKLGNGVWVGWNYWYGGGKHGEPESIDWMDQAYELDVLEEEKLVIVKTFNWKKSE